MTLETNTPSPEQTFGSPEGTNVPTGNPGIAEGAAPDQNAPATAAPAITADMIRQAVEQGGQAAARAAIESQRANAPKGAPPPPTPEEQAEFERQFHVVKVTPEMFKNIMGVAPQNQEQLKALEATLHATAKQAIAMSTYTANQNFEAKLKEMQTTMDQRLAPIFDTHQQAQFAQAEKQFIEQNADLKDHAALVKEVALATLAQVQSGALKFTDRNAANKFVADKVRSLLGKAAPTGQNPGQRQTARRSMTPTSVGGGPGSGRPLQPANNGTISPRDVFKDDQ